MVDVSLQPSQVLGDDILHSVGWWVFVCRWRKAIDRNVSVQRQMMLRELEKNLLESAVEPLHQLSSKLIKLQSGNCFHMVGLIFHASKMVVQRICHCLRIKTDLVPIDGTICFILYECVNGN